MTIALACYVILPTGLDLRPYRVYGSDLFAQAVRMLYATDTPLNVCPSIHVFNSVTLMMAYYRSRIFETPGRRWMRPASAVLCVSIIASTVLLKQHSCIDVLLGILLAMALDTGMTALEHSDARALQRLWICTEKHPCRRWHGCFCILGHYGAGAVNSFRCAVSSSSASLAADV